jgi:hypothetical protein
MYDSRRFTFSRDGEIFAREAGLAKAAENFKNDNNLYADEIDTPRSGLDDDEKWQELRYEAHELVSGTAERIEVDFILARLSKESPADWMIGGNDTDANLLGWPEPARHVLTRALQDACVLSGAEGMYLLKESPEIRTKLEEMLGDFLAAAAFAGAYLLKAPEELAVRSELESGITREISFPAGFHGDFRVAVGEVYSNGSVTPLGRAALFAPLPERKIFAAYHSVEPGILLAAMKHLDVIGMESADQIMIYETLIEQIGETSYGGNFGDFGDDDLRNRLYEIENERGYWDKTIALARANPKIEFELLRSIVIPRNDNLRFVIASKGNKFIIKNINRQGNDEESEGFELNTDELAVFIRTMIMTPGGRTAPQNLVEMIKARVKKIKTTLQ